ncbi:MAG: NAD(P)/FAD-dependent oxidoreductase [Pseudomonadales bacterium]|nr:NAD(P)/FAD-dependent oxidoreductase [Pseudomonadales bacterium]
MDIANKTITNNAASNVKVDKEILIIGAGISGIGTGIELKKHHMNSFMILEKSDSPGGTWRDASYPGIAVDIPSFSYSFSYELNPEWSKMFCEGDEIRQYVDNCAKKYGIYSHFRFNSKVEKTVFDTDSNTWTTHLSDGTKLVSNYVIAATGILNQPKYPDIPGMDSFTGKTMHTARWDHDYSLDNKKVAIIGTGASAVQIIPAIAKQVKSMTVFQRTPIWVMPRYNLKISKLAQSVFKHVPFVSRSIRNMTDAGLNLGAYTAVNYSRFPSLTRNAESTCIKHVNKQIEDPATIKKLIPKYDFGCKRPAISNEYFPTFNQKNIELTTEGIERITEKGIVTADGVEHEVDLLIWATGYKTQEPGNAPSFGVIGSKNYDLGDFWYENRYQAYNGVSVPDFPNFFLTFGPYTGGLNWFSMLEANALFIVRCLKEAKRKKSRYIEVTQQANDEYLADMLERSEGSVFNNAACSEANSYYFDNHGEASLPSPFTPLWRWFRVRLVDLDAYRFAPLKTGSQSSKSPTPLSEVQ